MLTGAVDVTPMSKSALETSDQHKPEAHEEGTDEEQWTASPSVDVEDGGH